MAKLSTQPYKGTRDFLPEEMSIRTQVFQTLFRTVETFGFQRYDGPILEPAAIYEAKSGEEIANQQLYTLIDKSGRKLALRPEMTPSVARIIADNSRRISFPARWYSFVNCHRYERPQRGRTREHWQLNVDIFGNDSVEAEIEIFELVASMMSALGASPNIYMLRVNDRTLVWGALTRCVGIPQERLIDVSMVIDRWEKVSEETRLKTLDELGLNANQIMKLEELSCMNLDAYCEAAGTEAAKRSRVVQILKSETCEAPLKFDPFIIRAFNYYTSTVFEVFDVSPENNRSLFGGGRYDDLASLFSNERIPGIGFGMGDVTTWDFLESHRLLPDPNLGPDIYVFTTAEDYRPAVRSICRDLRSAGIRVVPSYESVSIGSGLKCANKLSARFTVIFAENEMKNGSVLVKNMQTSEQWELSQREAVQTIKNILY
jgi:histidyl-tRNA synthetase